MEIRMHIEKPPTELLKALEKAHLRYTLPVAIYRYFSSGIECADYGVFGDGDNAAYEWFLWRNGVLETSDVAYGSPTVALRDALVKVLA